MNLEEARKKFVENLGDVYSLYGSKIPKEALSGLLVERDGRIVINFVRFFALAPVSKRKVLETYKRIVKKGDEKGSIFNLGDYGTFFKSIFEGFGRCLSSPTGYRRFTAERKVSDD